MVDCGIAGQTLFSKIGVCLDTFLYLLTQCKESFSSNKYFTILKVKNENKCNMVFGLIVKGSVLMQGVQQ